MNAPTNRKAQIARAIECMREAGEVQFAEGMQSRFGVSAAVTPTSNTVAELSQVVDKLLKRVSSLEAHNNWMRAAIGTLQRNEDLPIDKRAPIAPLEPSPSIEDMFDEKEPPKPARKLSTRPLRTPPPELDEKYGAAVEIAVKMDRPCARVLRDALNIGNERAKGLLDRMIAEGILVVVEGKGSRRTLEPASGDPLLQEVIQAIRETGDTVIVSMAQRFGVNLARMRRIFDALGHAGILTAADGAGRRKISPKFATATWKQNKQNDAADAPKRTWRQILNLKESLNE